MKLIKVLCRSSIKTKKRDEWKTARGCRKSREGERKRGVKENEKEREKERKREKERERKN